MFKKLSLLVLSFAIVQALTDVETEPFLNGGQNAVAGQYSSFVAIVLPGNQLCGGVIFNANHVLTSAACVLTINNFLVAPNQVSILPGAINVNFNLPRQAVQAIYVHSQYNPFTFENDIAVLRTVVNFVFPIASNPLVAPVIVSHWIAFDGQVCQVAGWNTANNFQQTINVPIVNREVCNALPLNFGRITETMLCAGLLTTGAGVCQGNRGAGLYCNGLLEGILSSGFGCGAANNPGVYSQTRYYLPWIQEQVRRQDIPPQNVSPIQRLP